MGWLLVVAFASGAVVVLTLPSASGLDGAATGRDLFHAEWLVLGTLIAYALLRLARASVVLGALGVVLSSAQMIFVVDTAAVRFSDNGLAMPAPAFWYGVAVTQSLIFLIAGIAGARQRLTDRKWVELVRRITVEPAASVANPEERVNSRGEPGTDARPDH